MAKCVATIEDCRIKRIANDLALATLLSCMSWQQKIRLVKWSWGSSDIGDALYEGDRGDLSKAFPKNGICEFVLEHAKVMGVEADRDTLEISLEF